MDGKPTNSKLGAEIVHTKTFSPRQLNGTYIQEVNPHNEIRPHCGSNPSVRIKIGAILMELWHLEGKIAHFVGDEVETNVHGLLK
jgi:hypothetical protein